MRFGPPGGPGRARPARRASLAGWPCLAGRWPAWLASWLARSGRLEEECRPPAPITAGGLFGIYNMPRDQVCGTFPSRITSGLFLTRSPRSYSAFGVPQAAMPNLFAVRQGAPATIRQIAGFCISAFAQQERRARTRHWKNETVTGRLKEQLKMLPHRCAKSTSFQ